MTVSFANSMTLQEELLNHDLDVAVFTRSESSLEFYALPFRHHSRQVAIIGKQHPWRNRKSIRVEELNGQVLIIREPGSEARRAMEKVIRQAGAPAKTPLTGTVSGIFALALPLSSAKNSMASRKLFKKSKSKGSVV